MLIICILLFFFCFSTSMFLPLTPSHRRSRDESTSGEDSHVGNISQEERRPTPTPIPTVVREEKGNRPIIKLTVAAESFLPAPASPADPISSACCAKFLRRPSAWGHVVGRWKMT